MIRTTPTIAHACCFSKLEPRPDLPGTSCDVDSVWSVVDGRALARMSDSSERVYGSMTELVRVHYLILTQSKDFIAIDVDLPSLPETFEVSVDWAKIHLAVYRIDQARRGTTIGRYWIRDVFQGSCIPIHCGLPLIVRIIASLRMVAQDAWSMVRGAHRWGRENDRISRAKKGCSVAIACSELFALLYSYGFVDDPSHTICGTGPGYGLSGLGLAHGEPCDRTWSCEEVRRFVEQEES